MEVKPLIEKLESSDEFVRWIKKNPKAYLTHALNILDNHTFGDWQFGYYIKATGKITVFELGDRINISPESDVFKKEDAIVKKLEKSKIKVELNKALEIANKTQQENYSHIMPQKTIIILQNIDQGQVWNMTFVAKSFEVLNIKVSSETGKVLTHDLKPLFEFSSSK